MDNPFVARGRGTIVTRVKNVEKVKQESNKKSLQITTRVTTYVQRIIEKVLTHNRVTHIKEKCE